MMNIEKYYVKPSTPHAIYDPEKSNNMQIQILKSSTRTHEHSNTHYKNTGTKLAKKIDECVFHFRQRTSS